MYGSERWTNVEDQEITGISLGGSFVESATSLNWTELPQEVQDRIAEGAEALIAWYDEYVVRA